MYSTREFCETVGCSYREADYWTRRGVLQPDHPQKGSGTQRVFSDVEMRVGAVVTSLRRMGMPLDVLLDVADELRERGRWTGSLFIDGAGNLRDEPCSRCWFIDLDELLAGLSLAA